MTRDEEGSIATAIGRAGPTRAFWRSHFEVWALGGLTQREYCERHGLGSKSFGNWRAQLKREDAVGPKARWGRYPRPAVGIITAAAIADRSR